MNGTPIRVSRRRLRRGRLRAADLVGVVRRQAGGAARHPPRDGREHRRGDRGRPRAPAVDRPLAAQVGQADDGARRLQVHLRVDFVARGAPHLRQPVRGGRGDVLHPQPARRADLGAGHPGVDHRRRSR